MTSRSTFPGPASPLKKKNPPGQPTFRKSTARASHVHTPPTQHAWLPSVVHMHLFCLGWSYGWCSTASKEGMWGKQTREKLSPVRNRTNTEDPQPRANVFIHSHRGLSSVALRKRDLKRARRCEKDGAWDRRRAKKVGIGVRLWKRARTHADLQAFTACETCLCLTAGDTSLWGWVVRSYIVVSLFFCLPTLLSSLLAPAPCAYEKKRKRSPRVWLVNCVPKVRQT